MGFALGPRRNAKRAARNALRNEVGVNEVTVQVIHDWLDDHPDDHAEIQVKHPEIYAAYVIMMEEGSTDETLVS